MLNSWGPRGRHHLPFVILYVSAFLYVLIFRVIYDIVPQHTETEFYPIEIMTTVMVLLSIIISYIIYLENREKCITLQNGTSTHESVRKGNRLLTQTMMNETEPNAEGRESTYKLDRAVIVLFFMYYLAESNWLPGRDYTVGTVMYGIISLVVCKFILESMYSSDRTVFTLFLLGIICIVIGSFFDAMTDGKLPFMLVEGDSVPFSRTLFEEVPELYASILFLHSLFLRYFDITRDHTINPMDIKSASVLITSACFCGIGNSFFLLDRGQAISIIRLAIGLLIISVGVLLPYIYFRYYYAPECVPQQEK